MKKMTREERGRLLCARLDSAEQQYRTLAYPNWSVLEDAVAGIFPPNLLSPATEVAANDSGRLIFQTNQTNLNMMLRLSNFMVAQAFDDMPSLRFTREPDMDEKSVTTTERLAEMLLDGGNAMEECRRAMRYMMTRGSWIMWPLVVKDHATPTEVRAGAMDPNDFVMAARAGQPIELPPGADYWAIKTAAETVLTTPELSLGLSVDEKQRIGDLLEMALIAHLRKNATGHDSGVSAKIRFQSTPYGGWCLWDNSVTDHKRKRWIARAVFLTPDEFKEDPTFTDEAKDAIQPIEPNSVHVESTRAATPEMTNGEALEENGRIKVWEVWDKSTWTREYVCKHATNFVGTIEKDKTYPYMTPEGVPMLKDFFPCVIRTPIMHTKESSTQSLGIPPLAPAWPFQIELIRTRTAYYNACKRSARVYVAAPGVSPDMLTKVTKAEDGTVVQADASYDKARHGDLLTKIEWGGAPQDYLIASQHIMADLANSVGVSLATLTGEPVADTLGQEKIAMQGSGVTQADVIKILEDGVSELAMNALLIFRYSASPQEWSAYLGKRGDDVTVDQRRVADVVKASSFEGRKLVCRFASSTRAEDFARLKMLMDFYALAFGPLGRDAMGMLYFDPKSFLTKIAKEMDIEGLTPYQPTEAELLMAAVSKMTAQQQGGGPPGTGGDRGAQGGAASGVGAQDGRKAGDQRGPAPIPGSQQRNRQPNSASNGAGIAMRPMNGGWQGR